MFEDSAGLTAAFERLSTDDALRAQLGHAAAVAFATRSSEMVALDHYIDLIGRLAGERDRTNVRERLEGA